ncbi:MAG TPA: protein kinase [Polyangiaceae bacterium]
MRICPRCSELFADDAGFCAFCGIELKRATDPFLGRTIAGRFRLTRKLGAGGMSNVYLARHVLIDRLSAIKMLRADLSLHPTHRERFLREARAVNRINHRNIVEITDVGEVDGAAYLVMEYVDGDSLLAHIQKAPLAWDRAVKIAWQIASALARAHQSNVIHRDLKPENVMIVNAPDFPDLVKLTDFGIAKMLDAPALTFTEQMFGTPGYIAPEYLEGLAPDGRADLYSLGCVLYEMLSGVLPYDAHGQSELLLKPLTTAPIPIGNKVKGLPLELESLVLRLLARKREDRPQDAFEVHDALGEILRRSQIEGGPVAMLTSVPPPPRDISPTLVEDVTDAETGSVLSLQEGERFSTANVGRVQTKEMASRWRAAIDELGSAIEKAARKGGKYAGDAARARPLQERAHELVTAVESASAKANDHQAKVDRLEADARELRSNMGRALDQLVRDLSRERIHRSALEKGEAAAGPGGLTTEIDRARRVELDLNFQIETLQSELAKRNEKLDADLAEATAHLEGAIFAVRRLTHELVRTLDEAASAVSTVAPSRRRMPSTSDG